MTARPQHRLTFRVRSYEADPRGRLTPPVLCRWLQEAATEHAAALGVAVESLISSGVAWVLTHLELTVDQWPRVGDELIVATWPQAMSRLTTERRFELVDSNGTRCGDATTWWLVLDLASRKPVRIPAMVAERLAEHGLGTRPSRPSDLPVPVHVDKELALAVRRSDLDVAGHVNNTSYVEWALEPVPDDLWRRSDLVSLEIGFLAECHHGQTIVSQASGDLESAPCEVSHQLVRADDFREVARARSAWRTSSSPVIP